MKNVNVSDVAAAIEAFAPLSLQESYDNCGLQVGDRLAEVSGILLAVDITESVIDEAIVKHCNMIISHHPLIFKGVKSLTGRSGVERAIMKAIANHINLYAAHTNADKTYGGVSFKMAQKLGLEHAEVLVPMESLLYKIVVFVPKQACQMVQQALYDAGAGQIGNYDHCSYQMEGTGSFRPLPGSHPYLGHVGEEHEEEEVRLEVIVEKHKLASCLHAMIQVHPYEEPAYDVITLNNVNSKYGLGVVATLNEAMEENQFLYFVKSVFNINAMRHSALTGRSIKKVALCGGSGAEFLEAAYGVGADAYLTGEFGYHRYFDIDNRLLVLEMGHYESEQFTKEIFYEQLIEKFSNFAILLSERDKSPISVL